ncbi:probable disease resistance protein At1g62630 [Phaseolus vulgaris]|uniref:probable disease resistance protein At1g62630 n=1 Tax=Phaseolus vulgaris TaxID=3885 RepID=UPI0035CC1CAE
MDDICKRIRDSAHKLLPMDGFVDSSKEENHNGGQKFHSSQQLQQPLQKKWTWTDYHRLDSLPKDIMKTLLIFPENAVIRKRNLINLWIGEGVVEGTENKIAEKLGEDLIDELLCSKVILRYGNGKGPSINKFGILPDFRRQMELFVTRKDVHHDGYIFRVSPFRNTRLNWLKLEQKEVTLVFPSRGYAKGIEKLTNLQVLKGFVINTPEKTSCRIPHLVYLKKLRKLSIHIGREAMIRDREFTTLEMFLALERLKISWSNSDLRYANILIGLPPNLMKLHLECFPGKSLRGCLYGERHLGKCMELNITGGKLESMEVDFKSYNLDILRLKYLKKLNVDINYLKLLFPMLKYAEIKQISNHSYTEHEWPF